MAQKSDSAVRCMYFCIRESGKGLSKMDAKIIIPLQFKADIWKHFGNKAKKYSKNNELDKENAVCKLCLVAVKY